jgi:hypothetical protein
LELQKYSIQGQTAVRQIQIWAAFLVYALRRYWWIILTLSAMGGILGYMSSRSTTNRYEVRAAFLMPTDDAVPEYERLLSRKLVAEATTDFRVSRWVDRGNRGMYEMYSESPFEVSVIAIAPALQDIKHELRLLPDQQFEIMIESASGIKRYSGRLGERLQAGGVTLVVRAIKAIGAYDLAANYYFTVNSEEAVASRFLANLEVVHSLEHPNRIGLIYTDAHPDLAFDLLEAFTLAYLEAYQRQRIELFVERLREVDTELKVLETQILALDNPTPFLLEIAEAGSQLSAQDSTAIHMLRQRLEIQKVEERLQAWRAYREEIQDPAALKRLLTTWLPDSGLDTLATLPVIDSLIAADKRRLVELAASSLDAKSQYLSRIAFRRAWETQWLKSKEETYSLELLLREKYLAALEESAAIELEIRKDKKGPQLIDPTYPVRTLGRSLRIKVLVATALGLLLLGIFLAVVLALIDRRFRSASHFMAVGLEPHSQLWCLETTALARRRQVANMELSWGTAHKCIAFVGGGHDANVLATDTATRLAAFGVRVALIGAQDHDEPTVYDRIDLPAGVTTGWWFSAAAQEFLQTLVAQKDRVLLCLPPPHEVPEVLAALRQADMVYYIVRKDETQVKAWQQWQHEAAESGFAYRAIWVD